MVGAILGSILFVLCQLLGGSAISLNTTKPPPTVYTGMSGTNNTSLTTREPQSVFVGTGGVDNTSLTTTTPDLTVYTGMSGSNNASLTIREPSPVFVGMGDVDNTSLTTTTPEAPVYINMAGVTITAPEPTVYVGVAGVDNPSCGSQESPCKTIKYSMDEHLDRNGRFTGRVVIKHTPLNTPFVEPDAIVLNKRLT
jgi:hypothetical protein